MDAVGQFLEGDDDLKIIIRPTRWPSIDSCAQFDRVPFSFLVLLQKSLDTIS